MTPEPSPLPASIELKVLGPLQLDSDQGPIQVGSFGLQRLLVRLALAGPGGVGTGLLGEDLGFNTTQALRVAVWRLRKCVGGAVTTLPAGYAVAGIDLDFDLFEQDVAAALRLEGGPRIEALGRSLDRWRGRALDGFESEFWAQPVAAQLEELRASARLAKAEESLRLGRHGRVIAELQELVGDYPLQDRPCGLLMEALAKSGRQTEALRVYQEHRQQLIAGVGTEPGEDLRRVELRISAGLEPTGGARSIGVARPGKLPRSSTSFVGRRHDRAAITNGLGTSVITTVVGVGGVGKTRLAIEVAADVQHERQGGVCFADLTRAGRDDDVLAVVREALGISSAAAATFEDLIEVIESVDLLLVLDNCEHVLRSVAPFAEQIGRYCPTVTILATSREALGIAGERVHAIPPLPTAVESVELFLDRVDAADRSFQMTDTTRASVEDLCSRLDGIPLAIELAAARVRAFSIEDLVDRIDADIHVLDRLGRTIVDRHDSLHAVLDWSFDLLSGTEQQALFSLACLAQPFSLTDAEGLLGHREATVTVAGLVNKSMLTRVGQGSHYRFLQTVQRYSLDRLAVQGEPDLVRANHADYVLRQAHKAVARIHGRDAGGAVRRLKDLFPNLRTAAQWAVDADRLEMAFALCDVIDPVFVLDLEVGALAADVMAHPNASRHAQSLLLDGFALHDGHLKGDIAPIDDARRLIERFLGGEPSAAVAAFGAMTLSYHGDHVGAVAAAEEIHVFCRAFPDSPTKRYSLQAVCYLTGKLEYREELQAGLAAAKREGSDYWIGTIGMSLAHLMAEVDRGQARELVRSCMAPALATEMPLLVQTSVLLWAAVGGLDDEQPSVEPPVVAVLTHELVQAQRGYRLRGHHFFVIATLMAATGHDELASRCLDAYDSLRTRSSSRTQALIDRARTEVDVLLAEGRVKRAPTATQDELAILVDEVERALHVAHPAPPE